MNTQKLDVLLHIFKESYVNQRVIAQQTGISLGMVNRSIKELISDGFLNDEMFVTKKTRDLIADCSPKRAIILAAGTGMRMAPINMETPKGLLELKQEPLIERLIRQLQSSGIEEINVVVGFLKEKFEYLIDAYGVKLILNPDYASKNNLYSLQLASGFLENSYIMPCDIWCRENPFSKQELYSWYMVSDRMDMASNMRVNRKMEIVAAKKDEKGNADIGICYLTRDDAAAVRERMTELCSSWHYDNSFWEESLYVNNKMSIPAKVCSSDEVIEINTYEQLQELNYNSNQLKCDARNVISQVLDVKDNEISVRSILKKGMTNRSFLIECRNRRYVMRIPDSGTDQLISRSNEQLVYQTIGDCGYTEHVLYMNPDTGYKLAEYCEGARQCDPQNRTDVVLCMDALRSFHDLNIKVKHRFDIYEQITYYEKLWKNYPSLYRDYQQTKEHVCALKSYVEKHIDRYVLSHIDAESGNFLIVKADEKHNNSGQDKVYMIDWEYAGMNDPDMDIAMFGIHAMYDRKQMDELIDIYYQGACPKEIRVKIYCYIAAGGLFWSNWCEYKRNLGTEFGMYALRQYQYAKEYYRIASAEIEKM